QAEDGIRDGHVTGVQTCALPISFGSGGITGKGIGEVPVGRHVPEAHNDMVFALIGEQFGFFGAVAVLGAYLVLFAAGIEIAAAKIGRASCRERVEVRVGGGVS